MTELECPICKGIEHKDKRWEIEQFVSQTQEQITQKTIAKKFSITNTMAGIYLNKLTELDILDKSKQGKNYIYKFKHEQLLEE